MDVVGKKVFGVPLRYCFLEIGSPCGMDGHHWNFARYTTQIP
jgi:hypothetical protein